MNWVGVSSINNFKCVPSLSFLLSNLYFLILPCCKNFSPFKMSEYDYLPEAIKRHLAIEAPITNWVDRTMQHKPAKHLSNYSMNVYAGLLSQQQQQVYSQPASYMTLQGLISPPFCTPIDIVDAEKICFTPSHSSSLDGLHPSSTPATFPNSSLAPP